MPSGSPARRRPAGLPEALVAFAAGLSLIAGTGTAARWPTPAEPVPAAAELASPKALTSVAAVPLRLSIPELGLEGKLVDLGRRTDGTLEVPADYDDVGRWAGGRPGDPVVLAGHVDSFDGPAVFFRLGELQPGDEVLLETTAGTVRHRVERVERHPKDAFPTFEVFAGDAPGGLRLVTCGGAFDRDARSYTENVVVYASAT